MEQKKVAIVTVDTHRIAAVEQLRTYAEIIGVPLEVALSPHELREAVKRHGSADLILLDTVGRSPRNDLGIAELRQLVQVAKPAETHLVLSATAKPGDLVEALDRFRPLNPTRLLFTKLDETASYGGLLSCCFVSDLPVSYLGTGQEVPDDIEEASPERIAQLVVYGGGS
jgi:flagellar biosynthesis protein FlhF